MSHERSSPAVQPGDDPRNGTAEESAVTSRVETFATRQAWEERGTSRRCPRTYSKRGGAALHLDADRRTVEARDDPITRARVRDDSP